MRRRGGGEEGTEQRPWLETTHAPVSVWMERCGCEWLGVVWCKSLRMKQGATASQDRTGFLFPFAHLWLHACGVAFECLFLVPVHSDVHQKHAQSRSSFANDMP